MSTLGYRGARRLLPFVVTALISAAVSAAFTVYAVLSTDGEMLRLAAKEQSDRMEADKELRERIDSVLFTQPGNFRFPGLGTFWRWKTDSSGRKQCVAVIDYLANGHGPDNCAQPVAGN